jgi:hypothetical protein
MKNELYWDGGYKAPAKHFRVIGVDTFPWPQEEYLVGDFSDLETAKAQEKTSPLITVMVFDDEGKRFRYEYT